MREGEGGRESVMIVVINILWFIDITSLSLSMGTETLSLILLNWMQITSFVNSSLEFLHKKTVLFGDVCLLTGFLGFCSHHAVQVMIDFSYTKNMNKPFYLLNLLILDKSTPSSFSFE